MIPITNYDFDDIQESPMKKMKVESESWNQPSIIAPLSIHPITSCKQFWKAGEYNGKTGFSSGAYDQT
ncbi:hypothetical protein HAX54_042531, partial [Datura stramonium]|nr:hypothetical protein [Datura stramonium]